MTKKWTAESFFKNIIKSGDCLEWAGYINPRTGYGETFYSGKHKRTHQIAFMLSRGYFPKSPNGVLHNCDNRKCINPNHLYEGTMRQNFDDMLQRNPRSIQARIKRELDKQRKENKNKIRREIVILRQNGWSYGKISKRFGKNMGTVYNLVKRFANRYPESQGIH